MLRCLVFFIFPLVFCFFPGISLVSAQGLEGGLYLGGLATQVDGDYSAGFNKAGMAFGGFVQFPFDDTWSLQVELGYEQLGSAREGILILRNHQLSLPWLLRYDLPIQLSDGEHHIGLMAGLVPGYLFSARSEFGTVTNLLDRYDLRGLTGIEYKFSDKISLVMRYGYSVLSFLNTNAPLANNLLGPGRVGLAHNYIQFNLRLWIIGS